MSNDFVDGIGRLYDEGDSDPYIPTRFAREAIREDYADWQQAVDDGLAFPESAVLLAAFGVESPYSVQGVELDYHNGDWQLNISTSQELHEIDLGADLPDWVWLWFYEMADDFGWDWELDYNGE